MSFQYTFEDREEVIQLQLAWANVIKGLTPKVPKAHLDKFLKPLSPKTIHGEVVHLNSPGPFVSEWVKSKYLGLLESGLSDELGQIVRLEFHNIGREISPVKFEDVGKLSSTTRPQLESSFRPNAKYKFENFVVGQQNRMAVAGAKAASLGPESKVNPLFIYGKSGLGKTHLLHAIAHEMVAREPGIRIDYVTAQAFAEQFVLALQSGKIDAFRRLQRNVDVWLVDDIQFIAGKDKTQEELFHTFNTLQQSGKQIILCSDRPPMELFLMDERLRSRFESGLVVDIQEPDTETRAAILLTKASQDDLDLPMEVAILLADAVRGNVRVLEGALTKLAVMASLEGGVITLEMAEQMVEKYYQSSVSAKPRFEQILSAVSRYYKISRDQILSESRQAPIVHARHVAVYVMRKMTGDSWNHLGSLFNKDHTSMMHAYQKIGEKMLCDRDLEATVNSLIREIRPH